MKLKQLYLNNKNVNIIDAAKTVFETLPVGLVPAHPIAGAENSGYHARRATLFVNHSVIPYDD